MQCSHCTVRTSLLSICCFGPAPLPLNELSKSKQTYRGLLSMSRSISEAGPSALQGVAWLLQPLLDSSDRRHMKVVQGDM